MKTEEPPLSEHEIARRREEATRASKPVGKNKSAPPPRREARTADKKGRR